MNLRVASSDDALFRRAARGRRRVALRSSSWRADGERAERLLADRTRFVLSDDDWAAFTAALDRPWRTSPLHSSSCSAVPDPGKCPASPTSRCSSGITSSTGSRPASLPWRSGSMSTHEAQRAWARRAPSSRPTPSRLASSAITSLTAASIEHAEVTERAAKGHATPCNPSGAARTPLLAVDRSVQRRGLGSFLLRDAMVRTVAAAEQLGIRASAGPRPARRGTGVLRAEWTAAGSQPTSCT